MAAYQSKIVAAGLLGLCMISCGCVARAEYDRVEFARRNADTRVTQLEREIADERAQREIVVAERNALRRELDAKLLLIENQSAEITRLASSLQKTQDYADEVLRKGLADPTMIEVTRLPPELENALREFAARHPESVEYLSDRGAVRWKSDLTFGLGSDTVQDAARSSLREFAQIVAGPAAADFEVVVVGHTDDVPIRKSIGAHPTNWHLSVHRSIAVMNELIGAGVPPTRVGVMGYGEFQPRVPNPEAGGNELNRRVEIFLVAKKNALSATSKS